MIKKTMTYTDYNGIERTEDFFFNLTKSEIMKMEMSVQGGMAEMINRIVNAKDVPAIMEVFEDLIRKAYGVKSADGKRFIKDPQLTAEFMQTEAYDQLFMELATDADAASKFVNGIVPQEMAKQIAAANK